MFQWPKRVGQPQLVSPKEGHSLSLRGGGPSPQEPPVRADPQPVSGSCSLRVETDQIPRNLQPVGKTQPLPQGPHRCPPGALSGFLQTKVQELLGGTLPAPRREELTQPKPSTNSVEAVRLFITSQMGSPRPRCAGGRCSGAAPGHRLLPATSSPFPAGFCTRRAAGRFTRGGEGQIKRAGAGRREAGSAPRAKLELERRYSGTDPRRSQHGPGRSRREAERVG